MNAGRTLDTDLRQRLQGLEADSLRRVLRELETPQGPEVVWNGKRLLNFSSNDYLGLAAEPFLVEAGKEALDRYGCGSGASRLVCGSLTPHGELEGALGEWKGTEAALVFSTGYAAAVGTIGALVGEGDVVILDKLCHASLIDGARLSGAVMRVYPHNQLQRLEAHLEWARRRFPEGRVLVVTEAVFSMDGDRAPLAEIVALKERFGAWLMVDEAHSTGLFGPRGCGLVSAAGVSAQVEVQMGTLSKALGGSGGYVCGSRALVDWLLNRARAFVYSTAPSPVVSAMGLAAVRWIQGDAASARRRRLRENVERLEAGVAGMNGGRKAESAILPLIVGHADRAVAASLRLLESGFWVPAIRYPTVPKGGARLRVTVSAVHSSGMMDQLAGALSAMGRFSEGECG